VGRFACDWPRLATTDPHAATCSLPVHRQSGGCGAPLRRGRRRGTCRRGPSRRGRRRGRRWSSPPARSGASQECGQLGLLGGAVEAVRVDGDDVGAACTRSRAARGRPGPARHRGGSWPREHHVTVRVEALGQFLGRVLEIALDGEAAPRPGPRPSGRCARSARRAQHACGRRPAQSAGPPMPAPGPRRRSGRSSPAAERRVDLDGRDLVEHRAICSAVADAPHASTMSRSTARAP